MTDWKQLLENWRESNKPKDLHFRKECEGFRCGAHKSWSEGHASLEPLLLRAIETLEHYASNDLWGDEAKRAVAEIKAELEKE